MINQQTSGLDHFDRVVVRSCEKTVWRFLCMFLFNLKKCQLEPLKYVIIMYPLTYVIIMFCDMSLVLKKIVINCSQRTDMY